MKRRLTRESSTAQETKLKKALSPSLPAALQNRRMNDLCVCVCECEFDCPHGRLECSPVCVCVYVLEWVGVSYVCSCGGTRTTHTRVHTSGTIATTEGRARSRVCVCTCDCRRGWVLMIKERSTQLYPITGTRTPHHSAETAHTNQAYTPILSRAHAYPVTRTGAPCHVHTRIT